MTGAAREEAKFRAVFAAAPDAMLLADDDRRYLDANPAACRLLQRPLEDILRLRVEDVTPAGVEVEAAWRAFISRGELKGEYRLQRPDGSTVDVDFHATADVIPGQHLSILRDVTDRKAAERERDEANARLREAYERANRIALTLQQAMLPPAVALRDVEVATRYRPATDAMAVGGDWYDLIDLASGRVAITVGDVMGHGLAAAGMMGQLRSALAAAIHAVADPALALDILDTYVRSPGSMLMATAFAALLDRERRTLTYSNAGHLPPLLLGATTRFLQEATAPPLAATPEPERRPQATVELPAGSTIVLYTDGLVERRGEDIDVGLRRLAAVAEALAGSDCETLADQLLAQLQPAGGVIDDDVAVVVVRF
jgi:PAS domain S-box-containing protein